MMRFLRSLFPAPVPFGIAFFLLFAIVLGLPLFFWAPAVESFTIGKEVPFQLGVTVLLALTVTAACFGEPIRIFLKPINGLLLVYTLWSTLSILWAEAPVLAQEEAFRNWVLFAFVILAQSLVGRSRRRVMALMWAVGTASLLIAVLTILRDFQGAFHARSVTVRDYLGDWRDVLLPVAFGNTSHLGDFLVLGFLVWAGVLVLARPAWLKVLCVMSLVIHAGALIVAWSVHSNLSLIIAALTLVYLLRFYFEKQDIQRWRIPAAALAICWIGVVGFYVVDHPANPHGSAVWARDAATSFQRTGRPLPPEGFSGGIFSQAFSSARWTSGFDTRLAIWYQTLEIIRQHPWLGAGAGNFTYAYPAAVTPLVTENPKLAPYAGSWTNAAHNEVLQAWAELGILGLFLLIALVGASLKAYWDRIQTGTSIGNAVILGVGFSMLVAMCIQSMMNFPLQMPTSMMIFYLLLVVPEMLPPKGNEPEELNVPVERPFGSIRLGVIMKNMAYPTEFSARLYTHKKIVSWVLSIAVLALTVPVMLWLLRPLQADVVYRQAYEQKRVADTFPSEGNYQTLVSLAQRTLDIWPTHVDARSTLQAAYLGTGDYQQVVEQTDKVLEKLNAIEVYQRRAEALERLGRSREAHPDWDEIFRRRPGVGRYFPQQFEAWLERQEEL